MITDKDFQESQWAKYYPYSKEMMINFANECVKKCVKNLEMHIDLNEDDWDRNPRAMFEDFREEQALKQ